MEDKIINEIVEETATETPPVEQEKMLPQSTVNELVGKARQEGRASALKEIYERYGVDTDDELNGILGKGQAYESLNDEYAVLTNTNKATMAENALLKSKVPEDRWEDVKLILGGKGLEITPENINAMITTHPEWKGTGAEAPVTASTPVIIRKLGNDPSPASPESEEEKAMKLYGMGGR